MKLLEIEHQFKIYRILLEGNYKSEQENKKYIDTKEVTAFIEIYFKESGEEWNKCMDCMGEIFTTVQYIEQQKTT